MTSREVNNLNIPGQEHQQGGQPGATRSGVAYRFMGALSDALSGGRSSRQSQQADARRSQEASENGGVEELLLLDEEPGLENEQPTREPQSENHEDPRVASHAPTPARESQGESEIEEIDMRREEVPWNKFAKPRGPLAWLKEDETIPKVYTQGASAAARPMGMNNMRNDLPWTVPGPRGLHTLGAALFTATFDPLRDAEGRPEASSLPAVELQQLGSNPPPGGQTKRNPPRAEGPRGLERPPGFPDPRPNSHGHEHGRGERNNEPRYNREQEQNYEEYYWSPEGIERPVPHDYRGPPNEPREYIPYQGLSNPGRDTGARNENSRGPNQYTNNAYAYSGRGQWDARAAPPAADNRNQNGTRGEHESPAEKSLNAVLSALPTLIGNQGQNVMSRISRIPVDKFYGKTDRVSPYEYLKRLENIAEANAVDLKDLIKYKIPLALCEDAAAWWDMHKETIDNWNDFRKEFLRAFSASNYEAKMKRDLARRFQGLDEPGSIYLRKITAMCKEIDARMSDGEIIHEVTEKLNPSYLRLIAGEKFYSLEHLEERLRGIEECEAKIDTYERPRERDHSIDRRFAYDPRGSRRVTFGDNRGGSPHPSRYPSGNGGRGNSQERWDGQGRGRSESQDRESGQERGRRDSRERWENRGPNGRGYDNYRPDQGRGDQDLRGQWENSGRNDQGWNYRRADQGRERRDSRDRWGGQGQGRSESRERGRDERGRAEYQGRRGEAERGRSQERQNAGQGRDGYQGQRRPQGREGSRERRGSVQVQAAEAQNAQIEQMKQYYQHDDWAYELSQQMGPKN